MHSADESELRLKMNNLKTFLRKNEIIRLVWIKFRAQWSVGTNENINIAGINVIIDRLLKGVTLSYDYQEAYKCLIL